MTDKIINEIVGKIRANRTVVLANSLENCHAHGLQSVVFEKRIDGGLNRLFVTDGNHTLWRNEMGSTPLGWGPLFTQSVAFHPHHCDVELVAVKGMFVNHTCQRSAFGYPCTRYLYTSSIGGNAGSFSVSDMETLIAIDRPRAVFQGESISLNADTFHTVSVPQYAKAAWVVHEGREDPRYNAVCYSNDQLEGFDFSEMYRPMRPEMLDAILDYLTN